MTDTQATELEILLPVHNESASIALTVDEIYESISPLASIGFIISEDGSSDGTPEILRELAEKYPMKLITSTARKGYATAIVDGLRLLEAPYVLCVDSDGQCDPADFARFWPRRGAARVLIGWRVNRRDTTLRKVLSGGYKRLFKLLFPVAIHDPSCPFVLAPKAIVDDLSGRLGILTHGLWWEFVGRVSSRGYPIVEIPIKHRARTAGATQIFTLQRLPGIAWTHTRGLLRVWRECQQAGAVLTRPLSDVSPGAGGK